MVPADANVQSHVADQLLSRCEIYEVGVEYFLLRSQMVERSVNLIDVEYAVRLQEWERGLLFLARDGVRLGLRDFREEDDVLPPVSGLDVLGPTHDFATEFTPLVVGSPEFALESVSHRCHPEQ